jgi:chromate transporter
MGTSAELTEVAAVAFKIGVIGFGGPAAHIALLQQEVVDRRKWLTSQQYLDAIGAANLIPGPTSTELILYVGWLRAGLPGLFVAGVCFISPAAVLTLCFAYLYIRYGSVPAAQPFFQGIQAAVLAIIATAGWQLARTAGRSALLVFIGAAVALTAAAGLPEIIALLVGGVAGMLILRGAAPRASSLFIAAPAAIVAKAASATTAMGSTASATAVIGANISLVKLGAFFLAVGSMLYGSGYVLIAFLEGWLVTRTHLLTRRQLLDAVAVGQFTPGPVSTTATFIGYLLRGYWGALVATLAIFLPSFLLVGSFARFVPRLRNSRNMSYFLDAINAGAVGLIFLVTVRLAIANLQSWGAAAISILSLAALVLGRVNATLVIVAGALLGHLMH